MIYLNNVIDYCLNRETIEVYKKDTGIFKLKAYKTNPENNKLFLLFNYVEQIFDRIKKCLIFKQNYSFNENKPFELIKYQTNFSTTLYLRIRDLQPLLVDVTKENLTEENLPYLLLLQDIENLARQNHIYPIGTRLHREYKNLVEWFQETEKANEFQKNIHNKKFDSNRLIMTLTILGKKIKEYAELAEKATDEFIIKVPPSKTTYGYQIDENGVFLFEEESVLIPLIQYPPENKEELVISYPSRQSISDSNLENPCNRTSNENCSTFIYQASSSETQTTSTTNQTAIINSTNNQTAIVNSTSNSTVNQKRYSTLPRNALKNMLGKLLTETNKIESNSVDKNELSQQKSKRNKIRVIYNEFKKERKTTEIQEPSIKEKRENEKILNVFCKQKKIRFSNLNQIVSNEILLQLLCQFNEEDAKMRLLQTFEAIEIELRSKTTNRYTKKKLGQSQAFGIYNNQIFIVDRLLANTGGFKKIHHVFFLHQKQVQMAIRAKIKQLSNSTNEFKTPWIQKTLQEAQLIEKIHEGTHPSKTYIVDPFLILHLSHSDKIKIESTQKPKAFIEEIDKNLKKPNLILFQKQYQNGSLVFNLSLYQQINYFIGVTQGLNYLLSLNKVHADFKIDNTVIGQNFDHDEIPLTVKLIDFGETANLNDSGNRGSPFNVPPENTKSSPTFELARESQFAPNATLTDKTDSFGVGYAMLEILTKSEYPVQYELNGVKTTRPVHMATLSQQDLESIKEQLNNQLETLENPEREIKLELMEICFNLLTIDPKKRSTCQVACNQLIRLRQNFFAEKLAKAGF